MGVLRTIIFNADESYGPSLRGTLTSFDSVRIVAEVEDPALLTQAVQQFPAEVLILHLDPNPEGLITIGGEIAANHPGLAVFALSESTDGQLILSVMRRGFREYITKPIDRPNLEDAFGKIIHQVDERGPTGKLITILGSAGGVGSTLLATNLAAELASLTSGRVTAVDLDYRFGQLATMFDVSPQHTIADLTQSPEAIEPQVIERALVQHSTRVHVLSAPTHFVQSENITAANCVGVLTSLLSMSEYVVVDGPSRYDVGASAILDVSDLTLLLVQLMVPSVRNAQRILQGMREAGFNLDRTKVICNRGGKESGPLVTADVETTLQKKVFETIPDDWPAVSSAVNLGEPLCLRAPKSKVRQSIRLLAERIHSPDDSMSEREVPRKSGKLLSKIFSEA
jgi:pilus assembly protein CpaE